MLAARTKQKPLPPRRDLLPNIKKDNSQKNLKRVIGGS
jgi:hypothetical protein